MFRKSFEGSEEFLGKFFFLILDIPKIKSSWKRKISKKGIILETLPKI